MLEDRLNEWVKKVVAAKNDTSRGCTNTRQMILDVDKIIAEEFDHTPMFFFENM